MGNVDKVVFQDIAEEAEEVVTDSTDLQESDVGTEAEVSPTAAEALHRGWQEKEDWTASGKDPEDWVDAKTFVERGKLMDVISKQSKKLKSMEKAVDQFKQYHAEVRKKAVEEARAKLLEEKAEAFEMNDHKRAVEIDEELKKVDADAAADTPEADSNAYKEYFQEEWIVNNAWYNQKRGMKASADQFGAEYYAAHPDASPEEIFEYVDKEIRKEFPDHFTRRRGNSPVEGTARSGKPSGNKGAIKSRMGELTDNERKIGNSFVSAGLFKNLEEYVEDLVKNGL